MKKLAFILACIMLVMSFATLAAFAANDTVTITFRTSDGTARFAVPNGCVSEVVIERERGYVLTADDYPELERFMPDTNQYEWETDLIGTAINEDVVIILNVIKNTNRYVVVFYDWDGKEILRYDDVHPGLGVTPPELEDRDGIMLTDWYCPEEPEHVFSYHAIQQNSNFYPVGHLRGDANHNDRLDAGDATLVLQWVVEDPRPKPWAGVYDFNKNDEVDAGDATGILRAVVGLK